VNAQAERSDADVTGVRDIIPYIFWPWLLISFGILLHRRVGGGSWKAQALKEVPAPVEFPPPPAPPAVADGAGPFTEASTTPGRSADATSASPVAVMVPQRDVRHRSRSLAEALDGVAMPCDLAPLMGTGPLDPRQVAFFTTGHEAAAVGSALADEFERLGFAITPEDDRSIRAARDADVVRARLASAALDSEAVMTELHPSAPEDALVVELKLT
jgi:hypothetical protein